MNRNIQTRLSIMMFIQFFVWGAWYVTMGTYLGATLQFDGVQIGSAYGAGAIAAMISPFFIGLIADRLFATEKVLGVMHLIGAVLMYFASTATEFWLFYLFLLAYTLSYFPTLALANAIGFHQMDNPEKEFPKVRVWGTIGWIAAGLLIWIIQSNISLTFSSEFPYLFSSEKVRDIESTNIPFQIAAFSSILLGLYSFTLPHTPPKHKAEKIGIREILGLDALILLKDRSFFILFISSILICIPLMFYYSFTNLFFNEVGFENAAGKMTMGQMSEIIFLLVMPFFFVRLGVKKMVAVGMAAWVIRYMLFALGNPGPMVWMFYAGIILHGICYDFFFVTGQIYADNKSPKHLRSSVQGMMAFATYGLGFFIGSLISGAIVKAYTSADGSAHDWGMIWWIPAIFALVVLIFFLLVFKDNSADKAEV